MQWAAVSAPQTAAAVEMPAIGLQTQAELHMGLIAITEPTH
jgi:hypothetical protein